MTIIDGAIMIAIIIIGILSVFSTCIIIAFVYDLIEDYLAKRAFKKRQENYKKRI